MRCSAGLIPPAPERHRATGGLHEPGCTRGRNRNARVRVPDPASHPGSAGSATEGILNYYPAASTPWIQFDDQYSARCVKSNGANVLIVTPIHDGSFLTAVPNQAWGLHVDDPNLALGNLVDLVQSEATDYTSAHRPSA